MYIECMSYLHLCTMMNLKMILPKQTICRLGYMSKMSLVFVNIGFSKKILEGTKKINGKDPPHCTCPSAILANSGIYVNRALKSISRLFFLFCSRLQPQCEPGGLITRSPLLPSLRW